MFWNHQNAGSVARSIAIACMLCALLVGPAQAAAPPELRVRTNENRRTLTLEYGPLQLPAGLAYSAPPVAIAASFALPVDGWLRAFEVTVVDANGRVIEPSLLHHAGLFAPDQRDLFTPAMRRIVAFGSETTPIRLPGELGYRVQRGDSILLLAALFNPTSVTYDAVSLRVTMVYADARADVAHVDVLPLYLDVLPPGHRIYDIPPGESERSNEWVPAISGKVLAFGGHLHQYGESVMIEDVTTGDTLWIGRATYDASGALSGVERKIYPRGLRLHADRTYRITARYRNPTDRTIPGAMGKIGGLMIPDRNQRVPAADRADADYIRDFEAMAQHEHAADHSGAGQHGHH